MPLTSGSSDDWLRPTRYLDSMSSQIVATATALTQSHNTPREKALAIFTHVRDSVKFGFAPDFYAMTASEVQQAGIGFCNTKSTLFVALLRAAGIPARQVFVDIDAAILSGVLEPGTLRVDHSYVEVRLDGMWIATDAYIVDPSLHRAAVRVITARGMPMGFGVHATGTIEWDGRKPSFSQFVPALQATARNHGVFDDVGDFYARARRTWNRRGLMTWLFFAQAAEAANTTLDRLRQTGLP